MPGRPGRGTKLTPQVHEKIVRAVRAGSFFSTACLHAGVSPETGWEWLRRGRGEDERRKTPLYAAFAEDIARANADAELRAQTQLVVAGQQDWRANLAYLERRFPERWALRRYEVQMAQNDEWEGPPATPQAPSDDRVAGILEVLAEAGVIVPPSEAEDDEAPA